MAKLLLAHGNDHVVEGARRTRGLNPTDMANLPAYASMRYACMTSCVDECSAEPTRVEALVCPVPDIALPDSHVPDIPVPDISLPDIPVPDIPVPDLPVPDIPVPDIPVPDIPVPDIPVPDILVPDLPVPNIPVPDIPVPDTPSCAPPRNAALQPCTLTARGLRAGADARLRLSIRHRRPLARPGRRRLTRVAPRERRPPQRCWFRSFVFMFCSLPRGDRCRVLRPPAARGVARRGCHGDQ
jgi:hypothetical protein